MAERDAVAAPDLEAAEAMWADYAAARPAAVAACSEHTVEHFGDNARLCEELLGLVLDGSKRATAELASAFTTAGDALPRIGSHWIACDSTGRPRVVLRSTALRIGPFGSADAAFAAAEAEGDRSLESWREGHRGYFERTCAARGMSWSEDDDIVFEHFDVVWPPEAAGTPAR